VKVAYAGICGSDLHIYRKGMFVKYAQEIMGHEFAGAIEEVGLGVTGFKQGDKVAGDPRVGCGGCTWCLQGDYNLCPDLGFIGEVSPGCFAEYILMDPRKLLQLPPEIDLRRAALVEPLAVAMHIIGQGSFTKETSLAIIGAGPIGLLTVLAAKAARIGRIAVLDISQSRLDMAKKLGADKVFTAFPDDPAEAVDAAVDAVGKEQTLNGALNWLKPGGRLVMAGIYEERAQIDPNFIVTKELSLVGVDAYGTADLKRSVAFLANCSSEIEQVISHVLPFSSAAQGFELLTTPGANCSKILLASEPDDK
jgi:2-desacetyl-2-hydroxyethyl bacteriochlorophyllide A dehydrogenase